MANKNVIIGNIYRPPRQNVDVIETFSEEVVHLFNLLQLYKHVIVAGDFNLDLLKIKENIHISKYFESLLSSSFIPKITLPTRLTETNGTLIDNFLVKGSNKFSESTVGILMQNISDHLPYFIKLDYLTKQNGPDKYIFHLEQNN